VPPSRWRRAWRYMITKICVICYSRDLNNPKHLLLLPLLSLNSLSCCAFLFTTTKRTLKKVKVKTANISGLVTCQSCLGPPIYMQKIRQLRVTNFGPVGLFFLQVFSEILVTSSDQSKCRDFCRYIGAQIYLEMYMDRIIWFGIFQVSCFYMQTGKRSQITLRTRMHQSPRCDVGQQGCPLHACNIRAMPVASVLHHKPTLQP